MLVAAHVAHAWVSISELTIDKHNTMSVCSLLDDDYVPYREAAPAHSLSRPIRAAIVSAASSTRFDLRYNEI